MIFGAHVVLYSTDAEADRAFLADVLGLDTVDAGGGWLIFALPPAEVALHPAEAPAAELYLMCDDLETEIRSLRERGLMCATVEEARWGSITKIPLPSGAARPLPTEASDRDRAASLVRLRASPHGAARRASRPLRSRPSRPSGGRR